MIDVEVRGDIVRFRVRVLPRASKNGFRGTQAGALKVAVTAPPVDGAANAALVEFLADELGVAKRNVRIASGESAKDKWIEVAGVTADQVRSLA